MDSSLKKPLHNNLTAPPRITTLHRAAATIVLPSSRNAERLHTASCGAVAHRDGGFLFMNHVQEYNHNQRYKDISGHRFGCLTAICFVRLSPNRSAVWLCQCDCGNTVEVLGSSLRSGNTRSCGCQIGIIHGHSKERSHRIWQRMMKRCYDPNATRFKDWGGRGISVCERWHTYENFLSDMGQCPDGMSINRKNNDGNYEPGNCDWATSIEQNNNRRDNRILEVGGVEHTVAEWSRISNIGPSTIMKRLNLGWTPKDAVTKPVRAKKQKIRASLFRPARINPMKDVTLSHRCVAVKFFASSLRSRTPRRSVGT